MGRVRLGVQLVLLSIVLVWGLVWGSNAITAQELEGLEAELLDVCPDRTNDLRAVVERNRTEADPTLERCYRQAHLIWGTDGAAPHANASKRSRDLFESLRSHFESQVHANPSVVYILPVALLVALIVFGRGYLRRRKHDEKQSDVESTPATESTPSGDLSSLKAFFEVELAGIRRSLRALESRSVTKDNLAEPTKFDQEPEPSPSSLSLSNAVRRHWSSTRDWRDLLQSPPAGLQVYEIQDVASMLGTTAYSTVPIQLKAADRQSTGPVFLGSKSSRDEPVLLFPLTEKSFGNDNSLSILRGLFDITPSLQSKTGFRFVHADEPCQLRPEGGSYRREKKGAIRTNQSSATTKRNTRTSSPQFAVEKPVENVAPVPTVDLAAIGEIVREEVRRELLREDPALRRLEAQLETVVRQLRNLEGRPVAPSARVVESVELAEPAESSKVEPREEKVEIRQSNRLVREAVETTRQGSNLRRGRRSRSVDLAEEVLGRMSLEGISRTGSKVEYSHDLEMLKDKIEQVTAQSEDCRVTFFQVSSSQQNQRDVVLEEVAIDSETGKFKPLHKASHVTSTWQVLLGLYDLDNEEPGQECALLFPWSMERGAPVVFNLLVDDRGMNTHASFVSCVQPAVLSLHEEGTYRVQRKMIVRALQTT